MLNLQHLLTVASLALLIPAGAHAADVYTTFTLDATLTSGTISGTVTFDDTTDAFTGSNLKAVYNGTDFSFTGAPILEEQDGSDFRVHFADVGRPGYFFGMDLTVDTLTNYKGGTLCSDTVSCGNLYSSIGFNTDVPLDYVDSGSLVRVSSTPEPSSLMLLGTGALSLAGAVRRRLRTS